MTNETQKAEPVDIAEETLRTNFWLFLRAIRGAAARAPLWVTTWFVISLLALLVAAPWHGWFTEALANRLAPGEALRTLSENFRSDHARALGALDDHTSQTAVILIPISVLVGIFAAGGWLQVILERSRGRSVRRFFFGGARYFWRFLRMALLAFLVLALVQWVVYGLPWDALVLERWLGLSASDRNPLDALDTELQAARLTWLQDGLGTLGFLFVSAWATFSRTRLALHDTRSVLWASINSFFLMLRRPIKTLRPLFLLFVFELVMVTLLAGELTRAVDAGLGAEGGVEAREAYLRIGALLAIGSLSLMLRELLRGAKYVAAVRVSQEIIRKTHRPDPWRAIGGPGGPQYPVDDAEDEYGVSM
ncbi:MAG: hypothetical protein GY711_03145 [bacterium]|nr:hypothetical protein [bacterium]